MISIFSRALFFGVIGSAAIWFAWMLADNEPPYVYTAGGSFVSPDPAPQGSMVQVDWKIASINRVCPGMVQRFFRDAKTRDIVATMDTTPVSRAVRKNDTHLPRAFQLPPKLPATVVYSAEACFQCNVLQYVFPLCYMTPELTFHVTQ